MLTVRELLRREDFFDAAVLRHGFVDYMRDYELLIGARDGPPNTDLHRYLFVGCTEATYEIVIEPSTFVRSLPDEYVLSGPDYPDRDDPDGFIWGVRYANVYPGLTYLENGDRAHHWSERLGRPMHEVLLETNAYRLRLVFADLRYQSLGHEGEESPVKKDYPIPLAHGDRTSDGAVS